MKEERNEGALFFDKKETWEEREEEKWWRIGFGVGRKRRRSRRVVTKRGVKRN